MVATKMTVDEVLKRGRTMEAEVINKLMSGNDAQCFTTEQYEQVRDADPLNPTCLHFELDDLDSSPWFYAVLEEFMQNNCGEAGCVYEFRGSFRNYKFRGKIYKVFDANVESK